jgi:hypothetical protein
MSNQIISQILNEIVETTSNNPYNQLNHEYGDHAVRARQYIIDYLVFPIEWRDEDGKLVELVFHSNEHTPTYWGMSMTLTFEDEEEYEQGDMDDYLREQEYYR